MPIQTTGITELDKLPSGKIAKGNKSNVCKPSKLTLPIVGLLPINQSV
jgi:hypothetical protein